MQVYLVGGAVRDALLGLAARERDWVVVGATPAELTAQGYTPVGQDFPVFLHPETREQYALARQERKTGPGYHGFQFQASPEVTLEDDLRRRDLTVNAMARDSQGRLIDPYGGQRDLERKALRHVSEAFVEDPVRILRVARFAARFSPLGFRVAPETLALMKRMVESGEADALVAERVWAETVRALAEPAPQVYFEVLRECGALNVVFPELDRLWGVPQPARWHPEIDTGVHVMLVLTAAARLSDSARVRFAALTHDLGKGTGDRSRWPSHHGHEERSVELVNELCERLRIPVDFRELALLAARWHGLCHRALELRAATVVDLLERLDAFRRPERFAECLLACEADYRGRAGMAERPYPQADFLRAARAAAVAITLPQAERATGTGAEVGRRLRALRVSAVKALARPAPPAD
jgi:tRNA nucleotidyltransferase (CCA-adding enzyme)